MTPFLAHALPISLGLVSAFYDKLNWSSQIDSSTPLFQSDYNIFDSFPLLIMLENERKRMSHKWLLHGQTQMNIIS